MRLTKLDIQQLANALKKQADIIRKAGAHALADALIVRANSFELVAIPVKTDESTSWRHRRGQ